MKKLFKSWIFWVVLVVIIAGLGLMWRRKQDISKIEKMADWIKNAPSQEWNDSIIASLPEGYSEDAYQAALFAAAAANLKKNGEIWFTA
jgi:hypothetical protein